MPAQLQTEMAAVRVRTLALVAHLGDPELERPVSAILSPLTWDLGHIAAYEDLWINQRLAGRPLLRPRLAEAYDAFETPRSRRGDLELPRGDEVRAYLAEVRARALAAPVGDGLIHELVLRHELQHCETMLQAMALAGRLPQPAPTPRPLPGAGAWAELERDVVWIGAGDQGFAYDNERPRHRVEVGPCRIARRPVTNASWLTFTEGGGYVRREWWSSEGWAWKEEYDITDAPDGARTSHPDAPVVHMSWFEADAFARAHGARLPTEFEWERAAASGQLAGVGEVWEWTCSPFAGYPGFSAHPYREYSEVFFGDPRYRVLRGWSAATASRAASVHFRNWDLPERRQLFAGVRLAADGCHG